LRQFFEPASVVAFSACNFCSSCSFILKSNSHTTFPNKLLFIQLTTFKQVAFVYKVNNSFIIADLLDYKENFFLGRKLLSKKCRKLQLLQAKLPQAN